MCRGATTRTVCHSAMDLPQWGIPMMAFDKMPQDVKMEQPMFDPYTLGLSELSIPQVPQVAVVDNQQQAGLPFMDDLSCLFQDLPQTTTFLNPSTPIVPRACMEQVVPVAAAADTDADFWAALSDSLSSPESSLDPLSPLSNPLSPEMAYSSTDEFLDAFSPQQMDMSVKTEPELNPVNKTTTTTTTTITKPKRSGGGGAVRSRKRRIHELDPVQRERARHLNRLSARRHRQVAKKKNEEAEQQLEQMKERNDSLSNEVIKLLAKRDTLLSLIRDMRSDC